MSARNFFSAIAIISMLPASVASACDQLHLQGVQFDAAHKIKARLSCLAKDGSPSPSLASDYTLFADGRSIAEGQRATASEEPIDLVAVVQVSPAMEAALPYLKKGLHQLVKSLAMDARNSFALVPYADEVQPGVSLGRMGSFELAVDKLTTVKDGTEVRLLPAIDAACDLFKKRPLGRRKVVVVLSDGVNSEMATKQTQRAFEKVGVRGRGAGIVVAPVAYAPFDPTQLRYLQNLAKNTGGHWRFAEQAERIAVECQALMEELQHQQLVTFSLPQYLNGDNAEFQVVHQSGEKSESVNGQVPIEAQSLPELKQVPDKEDVRRSDWVSLAGILLSISLFCLTLVRRPARVPAVHLSPSVPRESRAAQGKTTMLYQGKRILVGWVVRLDPDGKHETIEVSDILTLGQAPHRCQLGKLSDGFEIVELDGGGDRRRIEDGQRFQAGSETYKFKSVCR